MVGGKLKAGYTFYYETGSDAVSSISDKNRHGIQDSYRSRQSLAVVWHPMHPY